MKESIQVAESNQGGIVIHIKTISSQEQAVQNVKSTKNKEEETRRIRLVPFQACGWEWLYVTEYVCTGNSQLTEEG